MASSDGAGRLSMQLYTFYNFRKTILAKYRNNISLRSNFLIIVDIAAKFVQGGGWRNQAVKYEINTIHNHHHIAIQLISNLLSL